MWRKHYTAADAMEPSSKSWYKRISERNVAYISIATGALAFNFKWTKRSLPLEEGEYKVAIQIQSVFIDRHGTLIDKSVSFQLHINQVIFLPASETDSLCLFPVEEDDSAVQPLPLTLFFH